MPSNPEPAQPLTDEEHPFTSVDNGGPVSGERLAEIREQAEYCSITVESEELLWLLRQAEEVSQLRAENTAQVAKLEAVRKIQPQRRNSAMVTSEQLAAMRGWNDAVDAIREALNPCTCSLTDPSTWTTYGGLTEPGSTYQWEPDCPAHGDVPALDQPGERQANA